MTSQRKLSSRTVKADACLDVTKEASRAGSVEAENAVATALLQLPPASDMMHVDSSDSDSSDDETDDEELQAWAKMMFNIPPPIMVPVPRPLLLKLFIPLRTKNRTTKWNHRQEQSSPRLRLHLKMPPVNIQETETSKESSILDAKEGKGGSQSKGGR